MIKRTNQNGIVMAITRMYVRFGTVKRTPEIAEIDGGKVGDQTSSAGVGGYADDLVRFHCLLTKKDAQLARVAYLGSLDTLADGSRVSRGNVKIALVIKVGLGRADAVEVTTSRRVGVFADLLGAVSEDELKTRIYSFFLEATDRAMESATLTDAANEVELFAHRNMMNARDLKLLSDARKSIRYGQKGVDGASRDPLSVVLANLVGVAE